MSAMLKRQCFMTQFARKSLLTTVCLLALAATMPPMSGCGVLGNGNDCLEDLNDDLDDADDAEDVDEAFDDFFDDLYDDDCD